MQILGELWRVRRSAAFGPFPRTRRAKADSFESYLRSQPLNELQPRHFRTSTHFSALASPLDGWSLVVTTRPGDGDDRGEHDVREAQRHSTCNCRPVTGFGVLSRDRCCPALRAWS